ncbi:MAG: hydantoinase/oxoprolinase family protein, partial [Thermodesulfobacteriota bacterium]
MIKVGIDTGGTFTDFVIFDGTYLVTHKIPSTPSDPSQAIIKGLRDIIGEEIRDTEIIHGTTVATNALLERKGAKVALVTTKGFEDVIEIGRQNRGELYNLFWEPQEPLVKKGLRFGVDERVNYEGRVLKRLNIEEVRKLFAKLNKLKVEGIAISFLNSYVNSINEKKVEMILKPLGIPITTSSEILPEFREYERTSTIVTNSYLQPKVKSYMDVLSSRLKKSRVFVMQSSGGVIAPNQAGEEPVRILLSGPAGGVVGGYKIAETLGFKKVITYDMGGTSTDISLCDTSLMFTTETNINGIPIKMPMVDLITIGAGGGSIAHIDSGGALKVGPESAAADPGPACYGKGDYATVTDANVLLGRINPHWFLGGKMKIYPEKSRSALNSISTKLKLSLEQVAEGIIKISNANMERAL